MIEIKNQTPTTELVRFPAKQLDESILSVSDLEGGTKTGIVCESDNLKETEKLK